MNHINPDRSRLPVPVQVMRNEMPAQPVATAEEITRCGRKPGVDIYPREPRFQFPTIEAFIAYHCNQEKVTEKPITRTTDSRLS